MYKCLKVDFERLYKKIKKIGKKLDKNGLKWNFEKIGESIEEVNVIDYRNIDNLQFFTPKHLGTRAMEVITYNFDMEVLKLGDYELIAILDHNKTTDNNNFIHIYNDNLVPLKYRTIEGICEHCNINRKRNTTVLLKDTDGDIKQVGLTCLREYTGIDCMAIIGNYQEIKDICLTELAIDCESIGSTTSYYYKTIEYLACCIQLIKKEGYLKDNGEQMPTKFKAWKLLEKNLIDTDCLEIANNVIEYFKQTEFTIKQNFQQNIKIALLQEYTGLNGFISYGYVEYLNLINQAKKVQNETNKDSKSQFIGKIGDKLEIEVTLNKIFAYESEWGIIKIYLFEDINGNVYTWNTSNYINKEEGAILKVKGILKEHKEYNKVQQNVLTRCKVLA